MSKLDSTIGMRGATLAGLMFLASGCGDKRSDAEVVTDVLEGMVPYCEGFVHGNPAFDIHDQRFGFLRRSDSLSMFADGNSFFKRGNEIGCSYFRDGDAVVVGRQYMNGYGFLTKDSCLITPNAVSCNDGELVLDSEIVKSADRAASSVRRAVWDAINKRTFIGR